MNKQKCAHALTQTTYTHNASVKKKADKQKQSKRKQAKQTAQLKNNQPTNQPTKQACDS